MTRESQSACPQLLEGKSAVVFGVAHKSSLAWAIAEAYHQAGCRLAVTYQSERQERNLQRLAEGMPGVEVLPCDVTDENQVQQVFAELGRSFGGLDVLVHSIAFANRDDLAGRFVDTSREGYLLSQDISSYSLTALTRAALPLFEKAGGGSVITLTYLGGERVVSNYNVMGVAKAALDMSVRYLAADVGPLNVRVNAISAGPVKTLSARGVSGFTDILDHMREKAPLRRNILASEVGSTALFLASGLSSGMTGEVLHVDAGYHILGY